MRNVFLVGVLVFLATSPGFAKVVVFWQDGFPTMASQPAARKSLQDRGILISPTRFPHSRLYVVTSESGKPSDVSFQDQLSGKQFSGRLYPGCAAMLVVEENGNMSAAYNWIHNACLPLQKPKLISRYLLRRGL